MSKWLRATLSSLVVTLALGQGMAVAQKAETDEETSRPPVITIGLDVRTAAGQARTFERPGLAPAAWNQTFPVVQGDRVRIVARIDPKDGKLAAARLRLDNAVLSEAVEGPWDVSVDTASLQPGHHLIEVWAEMKSPGSGFRSVTTSFLVVPQDDPLLRVLLPEFVQAQAKLPQTNDKSLACTLTSANPTVANALKAGGTVALTQRALVEVKGAKAAHTYIYSLSRDGRVTYVSPVLDVMTYIELIPRSVDPAGLAPGAVVLSVWTSDSKGHFGPPCRATFAIK